MTNTCQAIRCAKGFGEYCWMRNKIHELKQRLIQCYKTYIIIRVMRLHLSILLIFLNEDNLYRIWITVSFLKDICMASTLFSWRIRVVKTIEMLQQYHVSVYACSNKNKDMHVRSDHHCTQYQSCCCCNAHSFKGALEGVQ